MDLSTPLRGPQLHTYGILFFVLIDIVFISQISFDVFRQHSNIIPWFTYLFMNAGLSLVGWLLYLWPTKSNWSKSDPLEMFPLYQQHSFSWILFDITLTLSTFGFNIAVFAINGIDFWPSLSDSPGSEATQQFYVMMILNFVLHAIRITILWDIIWAEILRCYDDQVAVWQRKVKRRTGMAGRLLPCSSSTN